MRAQSTAVAQVVLCELQLLPTAARVTVKSVVPGLSAIIAPAIQGLLQTSLGTSAPSASVPAGPVLLPSTGGPAPMVAQSVPGGGAPSPAVDILEGLF
jgi:hypothetical protein